MICQENRCNFHTRTRAEAWRLLEKTVFFSTVYRYDEKSSARGGCDTWRDVGNYYNYVCDVGDRFEINRYNGATVNVWYKH